MIQYLIKKILYSILVLAGVVVLVFFYSRALAILRDW